jgi:hypothetical protein
MQKGISRKIKVDEDMLPDELRKRLDQRFSLVQKATKKPSVTPIPQPEVVAQNKVEFDIALIEQLKQDSHDILTTLSSQDEVDSTEHVISTSRIAEDRLPEQELEQNPLARLGSGASTEVAAFAATLSVLEREFLSMFTDESEPIDSCTAFAKRNGMMLATLIHAINEKAVEHLGDVLLEEEEDQYIVVLDFIDIIDEVVQGVVIPA